MTPFSTKTFLPLESIRHALEPEIVILLSLLVLGTYVLYRTVLKELSAERHQNIKKLFRNLMFHVTLAMSFWVAFWTIELGFGGAPNLTRLSANLGFVALIWLCYSFIKVCRIMLFEYLFLRSMRQGVPLLLVNLATFILTLVLGLWIFYGVFHFNIAPLVATSTALSIVAGLAMQDTLGNLIAGVALQIDKPYGIGDWIEVQTGTQKWVGQVTEITWRAVILVGIYDEIQTIPNRLMSQAQVSNYSGKERPFLRSQIFRIPLGHSIDHVRKVMIESVQNLEGVRQDPKPLALYFESGDSWMGFKVVYSIYNFGAQFIMADKVNEAVTQALAKASIPLAFPTLRIEKLS